MTSSCWWVHTASSGQEVHRPPLHLMSYFCRDCQTISGQSIGLSVFKISSVEEPVHQSTRSWPASSRTTPPCLPGFHPCLQIRSIGELSQVRPPSRDTQSSEVASTLRMCSLLWCEFPWKRDLHPECLDSFYLRHRSISGTNESQLCICRETKRILNHSSGTAEDCQGNGGGVSFLHGKL